MEERESTFKLATKPGLIVSLIAIAISLVLWATIADLETRSYAGYITWLVIGFLYYKYTVDYRQDYNNGGLSYGESFKFMFFMTIIYAIIMTLYMFVFMTYIDPEMITQMKEMAAEKMYEQNMPEEQIEAAIEVQSMFITPIIISISTFFSLGIFGIILSLIISIFTKKEVIETFE